MSEEKHEQAQTGDEEITNQNLENPQAENNTAEPVADNSAGEETVEPTDESQPTESLEPPVAETSEEPQEASNSAPTSVEDDSSVEVPSAEETKDATTEPEVPEAATNEDEPSVETSEEVTQESATEEQAPESEEVVAEAAAEDTKSTESESSEGDTAQSEESDSAEKEEEPFIMPDFSGRTKEQLVEVVEALVNEQDFKKSGAILSEVLPLFKGITKSERTAALDKFVEEGGSKDDFEYRHDALFNRFDASVRLIRDRKASYFREQEAAKERNYEKKLAILDKLRDLVDGENATTNINPIRAIQEEWKQIGPVPNMHNKTLWANYNALMDRFYNNRHILFELKELDRKKNLKAKEELCEKAEALDQVESVKDAVIQLNELHEEYKRIGAVPREVQEQLWQRFKSASDKVYQKRKLFLDDLKSELKVNLEKKKKLIEEIRVYVNFQSDRINDWNAKTKEALAIQKQWETMGGLPREHAKEVNKAFWSAFKAFFHNKNEFFKKLESQRYENLEKKKELVAEADALKESTEWDKTSEALKALQRKWKEIGPVPEKHRNSVYEEFKKACDHFFNNRRESQNSAEAEYVNNLKAKEALCQTIEDAASAKSGSLKEMDEFMSQFDEMGYVPKNSIRTIEERFTNALKAFVTSLELDEEEHATQMMKAELGGSRRGAGADRRLNKKEQTIRKRIQDLENEISLWNNNLAFFANSKTADKLKAEFDTKIASAEEEVAKLKKQLRVLRSM